MSLLKRRRPESEAVWREAEPTAADTPDKPGRSGGKGRPTPKRRAAQARGLRPVVPADRKAAQRQARAARQEAFQRQQDAMRTGEDRYLPARDKGPIKRYIRDYIDARFCIGEVFMPLALILVVLSFSMSFFARTAQATGLYGLLAVYSVFFLAIGDCVLCWWQVRRRLHAKFGREKVQEQGVIFFYVFSRCLQMRRLRQPAPQVARREYPS